MIVQNRKPRDGHREDFRKFLEPMFDPAFPVVHPFPEQEGPPHAARHAVIPAGHGRINQFVSCVALLENICKTRNFLIAISINAGQTSASYRLLKAGNRCWSGWPHCANQSHGRGFFIHSGIRGHHGFLALNVPTVRGCVRYRGQGNCESAELRFVGQFGHRCECGHLLPGIR